MSSTPLTDNALSRPAGLMVSLRLLAAIVIFAAIAPGILMTAPAVAAQLASEWQLKPGQIGWLFSAELGAMSLATLPAWWWMSRLDWRRVALTAGVVFLAANLASAVVTQYETLLAARFIASLAGGTLMILCISCAAGTPNPSRVYAFWVLGQLLLGMLGLLALPGLFATFGLKVVYLILAAIMLCCLPLVSAFPPRFQPLSVSRQQPSTALWRQALAVLAVLTFYISLSAVWILAREMDLQAVRDIRARIPDGTVGLVPSVAARLFQEMRQDPAEPGPGEHQGGGAAGSERRPRSFRRLSKTLVYFTTSLKSNEIVMEKLTTLPRIKQYPEDEDRIEHIYSLDGPGFPEAVVRSFELPPARRCRKSARAICLMALALVSAWRAWRPLSSGSGAAVCDVRLSASPRPPPLQPLAARRLPPLLYWAPSGC